MSAIVEAIEEYRATLTKGVELIAVSKTFPKEYIEDAYTCGQRHFGENKVQELSDKAESLPKDIKWHFIGHMQTNKIKYIAPYIYMIHSVDSLKVLEAINKEAAKNQRTIKVLMQIHVAQEETKFGLLPEELYALLDEGKWKELNNVSICGLMGMASFTDDMQQVRNEFTTIKNIFDTCKGKYFTDNSDFCEISMGMTGDYKIAMECGSTLVRIGNGIFGKRYYQMQ
ncbi:MAG: YggS family pyridoxal phosphate-dependent enzyme [Bacteroidales bacterium]|nr:YggS family pyridoxal phosphate-dependent enzyme [Bacteroidales bacterium]